MNTSTWEKMYLEKNILQSNTVLANRCHIQISGYLCSGIQYWQKYDKNEKKSKWTKSPAVPPRACSLQKTCLGALSGFHQGCPHPFCFCFCFVFSFFLSFFPFFLSFPSFFETPFRVFTLKKNEISRPWSTQKCELEISGISKMHFPCKIRRRPYEHHLPVD